MTSQVVFKVDKKIKAQAMKKAQSEGIALSSILKLATQAYIEGDLQLGLKFNSHTRKELDRILKDVDHGKNLSPAFKSGAEIRSYVRGNGR